MQLVHQLSFQKVLLAFDCGVRDVRKHLYWGVVIFGHFVPDSAFGTHAMLFVMVI